MSCKFDEAVFKKVKANWDALAKPLDSMGDFELITARIGGILGSDELDLNRRAVVTFISDNGVVESGISQSGQEVTAAVARAMGKREANIAKMCKVAKADFFPVDIGINSDGKIEGLIDKKIAKGTKNFIKEPAMTETEAKAAMKVGAGLVHGFLAEGYDLVGIGEMGIGNTTTTAAVISALLNEKPERIAGYGAGLSREGLNHKIEVIETAIDKYNLYDADPLKILSSVGGFDIAAMAGFIMEGAKEGLPVVLDGVISAAAALLAERMMEGSGKQCIPSHMSKEAAAAIVFKELGLSPVINGNMALGEGCGAAMFFSLLDHALVLYNKQLSFEDIEIEAYERFEE